MLNHKLWLSESSSSHRQIHWGRGLNSMCDVWVVHITYGLSRPENESTYAYNPLQFWELETKGFQEGFPRFDCNLSSKRIKDLNCSHPSWGGRNYILKWVVFVQSILADQHYHCRELRLVSLESLSSVEYKFKKIFSFFVFYRELSRFKFWENRVNSGQILFTFSKILD